VLCLAKTAPWSITSFILTSKIQAKGQEPLSNALQAFLGPSYDKKHRPFLFGIVYKQARIFTLPPSQPEKNAPE
jgi:hypothetical protein